MVIDPDGTGSCKSNYHTITTTIAPKNMYIVCLSFGVRFNSVFFQDPVPLLKIKSSRENMIKIHMKKNIDEMI